MRYLGPPADCYRCPAAGPDLRVTVYEDFAPAEITDGISKWAKESLNKDVTVKVTVIGNYDEAYNAIRTATADVCVATSNMLGSERYKLITGKLVRSIDPAVLTQRRRSWSWESQVRGLGYKSVISLIRACRRAASAPSVKVPKCCLPHQRRLAWSLVVLV